MLDIGRRQLKYWVDSGVVVPAYGDGNGKGSRRLFNVRNLVEIAIVGSVISMKMSLSISGKILHVLKDDGYFERLPKKERGKEVSYVVVKHNSDVIAVRDDKELPAWQPPFGFFRPNNPSNAFLFICLKVIEHNVACAVQERESEIAGSVSSNAEALAAGGH